MDSSQPPNLNIFIGDNSYEDDMIFDELERRRNTSDSRRFSFSIPNDIPPAPPPSPQLGPRLTKNIPEEKDDDIELDVLESNPPTPTDIQPTLDFNKEMLLISSINDNHVYKRPSKKSAEARKIWRYAKIPSIATIYEIEYKLLDWAFTYASLEIVDKKIVKVTWRSPNNCVCSSKWSTFIRWMICATLSV